MTTLITTINKTDIICGVFFVFSKRDCQSTENKNFDKTTVSVFSAPSDFNGAVCPPGGTKGTLRYRVKEAMPSLSSLTL